MKNKNQIIGLSVFLGYLLLSFFSDNILLLFGIDRLSNTLKVIISLVYELFILMSIIIIYLNTITKNLKDYKNKFNNYLSYIKYWFLCLGLMMISNIIITMITSINSSTNQEYIVKLLDKYPFYTIIISAIIAPITEELVFRLSIRKIFNNDYLFIIISGLLFGLLHLTVAKSALELLYIIPYSIPGFIFAYTLKKSKNIFVPISLHMLHNTVMILLQFLITIR